MADKKISAFTTFTTLALGDFIPFDNIDEGNATRNAKITLANFAVVVETEMTSGQTARAIPRVNTAGLAYEDTSILSNTNPQVTSSDDNRMFELRSESTPVTEDHPPHQDDRESTIAIFGDTTGADEPGLHLISNRVGIRGSHICFIAIGGGSNDRVFILNQNSTDETLEFAYGQANVDNWRPAGDSLTSYAQNFALHADSQIAFGGSGSFGSAVGVCLFIKDITTAPSGTPSGGGTLYSEAGALKWKGSSGTVTTLGVA